MDDRKEAGDILGRALKLPAEARAAMAGRLLESLDDGAIDEDAEHAWAVEVSRRLKEIESATVTPIPWAEARRRILAAADGSRTG